MPATPPPGPEPPPPLSGVEGGKDGSLGQLLAEILISLQTLLAGKLRLAQLELRESRSLLLSVLALAAGAGILLSLALALSGVAAALFLEDRLRPPGLGWLLVAGFYLLLGLLGLLLARRRLRKLGGMLRESRTDLSRDLEWLKKIL